MRKPVLALVILIVALAAIVLFSIAKPAPPQTQNLPPQNNTPQNAASFPPVADSSPNITIAAFNIQVFGQAKAAKPDVMSVLSRIARHFDVMAIEELRDENESTLPAYLASINSLPGPAYAAVSSPRLGRTSSKENYAFVYDTSRIALVPGSDYTFQDPPPGTSTDLFQREPFIARFRALPDNHTFVLIVIHTDPDTTPQELGDLPLVLDDARSRFPDEKDFIMLGDMNADCSYLSPGDNLSLRNASFDWLIPDGTDTTTKTTNCTYDRIIIPDAMKDDLTGEWGVLRFDQEYGLNQTQTEAVSDHYPVWIGLR